MDRKGLAEDRARLVVSLTGGVLGRALDWCDEPQRLKRRDQVIRVARALRRADLNQTLEMADALVKEIESPVKELSTRYQEMKEELSDGRLDDAALKKLSRRLDEECRREQIKEEVSGVKEVLAILSWWYRDILIMEECGDTSLVVNKDLKAELIAESEALPQARVLGCIDVLKESAGAAERNVGPRINVESTLMSLQEVLYA
jgi:hypothetical protein